MPLLSDILSEGISAEDRAYSSVERQGVETQKVQYPEGKISYQEEQKIVETVKDAFKDEEFMKGYLNSISKGDDPLKKIVDNPLKKIVEDHQLDWENLQKMLKDPAVRQKVMEELHNDPGKVDELLASKEVKEVLSAVYKAGVKKSANEYNLLAFSSAICALIVISLLHERQQMQQARVQRVQLFRQALQEMQARVQQVLQEGQQEQQARARRMQQDL